MSDEVPPAFICPISCEMMHDPVLSEDGFTYESMAIQAWFDKLASEGKPTRSPLTSEDVGSSLFSNKLLLVQIAAYRAKMNMGAPRQQQLRGEVMMSPAEEETKPHPDDDEWTVCAKAQRSFKGKTEAGPTFLARSSVDNCRPVGKMLYCFYCKCFGHEGWLGDRHGEFVLDENGMRQIVCERLAKKQEADRNMGRPGDWTCSCCSMLNFVGKTACFVCSATRKPGKVVASKESVSEASASASASAAPPSKWACSACTFEQPWASACSVCETPNENHWKPVHGLTQRCYICAVDLTSGDVVHIHGKRHATNVALRGLKDALSLGDPSMKPPELGHPQHPKLPSVHVPQVIRFRCAVCALDMAINQKEAHLAGKKHQERLLQMVSQTSSR